jgi:hypothetical protein
MPVFDVVAPKAIAPALGLGERGQQWTPAKFSDH